MSQTTLPRASGTLLGAATAFALFWRVTVTLGTTFPLDVSAVLILGDIVISLAVGGAVYYSILGEIPDDDMEAADE